MKHCTHERTETRHVETNVSTFDATHCIDCDARLCGCGCGEPVYVRWQWSRFVDASHKRAFEVAERDRQKRILAKITKPKRKRPNATRKPRVQVSGAETVALLDYLVHHGHGKTRAEAAAKAIEYCADDFRQFVYEQHQRSAPKDAQALTL